MSPPCSPLQRKVGNEPDTTKTAKKRDRKDAANNQTPSVANPVLTSIFCQSGGSTSANAAAPASQPRASSLPPNKSQQELARVAVGKGIRHRFSLSSSSKPAPLPPRAGDLPPATPPTELLNNQASRTSLSIGVQEGLSALESNYKSSLTASNLGESNASESENQEGNLSGIEPYYPGTMSHNDSLVDLAMIPLLEDSNEQSDSLPFTFIDFPWHDPNTSPS
jgi:hypothetical protein